MLSLLFACADRTVATEQAPPAPAPAAEAPAKVAPTPPRPRVAPATLPATPPEPPPPTSAPPPGTPGAEGQIGHLLALDGQRAVVRFFVPGFDHAKQWWVAGMRRDGSIEWVQTLSGDVSMTESQVEFARAGDAVSIATWEMAGEDPRLTLRGFALADGEPRFTVELGVGYLQNTVTDGQLRFDTRVHYPRDAGDVEGELVATGPRGVAWRTKIGPPIPVGHDPTIVGDAIAVRSEQRRERETLWQVFERASGTPRGELRAEPQSCSDGKKWFVRGKEGLLAVDPATVTTRLVLPPPTLPGATSPWVIEDCTIADGTPVVLVARGRRKALVALDPTSLAIAGHVEVGAAAIGFTGFDPLPARAHRAVVLHALAGEGEEVIVADPAASKLVGRWRSRAEFGGLYNMVFWTGGVAITTGSTVASFAADTGELEGRLVMKEGSLQPGQIAGETLWLPPAGPMRLGQRAPRVLSLAGRVADEVRDAVLLDVRTAEEAEAEALKAGKKPPCPDPRDIVRGDGLGVDPQPAPVARGRLPAWDLEALYETARLLACAPGDAPVRLMAWFVMEDDRPLRNDNALLLVEDAKASPPRYSLVTVYRHATNHEWNTIGSFHDRREPVRTHDHRPTRAEVDAFLDQAEWTFADAWGKVIAGNVVDSEWQAATGEAPWRSFAKAIEQAD